VEIDSESIFESPKGDKANYNVNMVDTPGLFEKLENGSERDDDIITNLILECLRLEITRIHCLFFVASFETGIDREQIEAILKLLEIFKGAEGQMCLLITRSELRNAKEREKLEEQIRKVQELKELWEHKIKIFFIGAVPNTVRENGLIDNLKFGLSNLLAMRTEIYTHLFSLRGSNKSIYIKDLDLFQKEEKKAADLMDEINVLRDQIKDAKGDKEAVKLLQSKCYALNERLARKTTMLESVTSASNVKKWKEFSTKLLKEHEKLDKN